MANLAHGTGSGAGQRDRMVFAVILIVVGALGLVTQFLELPTNAGGWVVALIGLGLLGAFFYTRQYGLLVPGSIMTGLGAGIIASDTMALANDEASGGLIVLGLGLGFLGIYGVAALVRLTPNHWWPAIPGGILTVVGAALLIGGQAVDLLEYWGIAVLAIGIVVLATAFRQRGAAE